MPSSMINGFVRSLPKILGVVATVGFDAVILASFKFSTSMYYIAAMPVSVIGSSKKSNTYIYSNRNLNGCFMAFA